MLTLLRLFLFLPMPKTSSKEAISIAAKFACEQGWLVENPKVVEELRTWMVWTHSNMKGSPWIKIDNQTGEVVRYGFLPR